jgi:hypothetical protein
MSAQPSGREDVNLSRPAADVMWRPLRRDSETTNSE